MAGAGEGPGSGLLIQAIILGSSGLAGDSYQVALIEVRKAIVGAHLRVRPLVGGHIGPPQREKTYYLYERNFVSSVGREEKGIHRGERPESGYEAG